MLCKSSWVIAVILFLVFMVFLFNGNMLFIPFIIYFNNDKKKFNKIFPAFKDAIKDHYFPFLF